MDLSMFWTQLTTKLHALFVSPSAAFSISSLTCAFLIAAGWMALRRIRRGRRVRLKVVLRAVLPKKLWDNRSTRFDLLHFLLNIGLFVVIIATFVVSYQALSNLVLKGLVGTFGDPTPTSLPVWFTVAITTLVMYLAYEFAYWLDHFLSHSIPFLWEFHRVHHAAEVLTPATHWRVHPVDSLVFANVTSLVMAPVNAILVYSWGGASYEATFGDGNLLMVLGLHTVVHLQHSHVWIPFTGWLGHVLMSPAHHQIHHSTNPVHFNKNMGSTTCLWDWLFGTLYIPSKEPEVVEFGVDPEGEDVHSVKDGIFSPFRRAFAHLYRPAPQETPAPR